MAESESERLQAAIWAALGISGHGALLPVGASLSALAFVAGAVIGQASEADREVLTGQFVRWLADGIASAAAQTRGAIHPPGNA